MNVLKEQFLELLRAGLWGHEADVSLFRRENTDWYAILETAKAQTVIAVVFDGMETLPSELRPPRKLFMEWYSLVLKIERSNELMDRVISEVFEILHDNGINAVLLKGHGMAANYIRPNHRQCGDIDIFTGPENCRKADRVLMEHGARQTVSQSEKHSIFELYGIHIENHIHTHTFNNPRLDRRYQKLEKEHIYSHTYHMDICGTSVTTSPAEFNAVFILAHITIHLLRTGIGLRQICDLAMLMHHSRTADKNLIAAMTKELRITRMAGAIGHIASEYLGLPENEVLFPTVKKEDSGKILNEILNTGNFGLYDSRRGGYHRGYINRKYHSAIYAAKKIIRLGRYFPAQLFWGPVTIIKQNIIELGKRQ